MSEKYEHIYGPVPSRRLGLSLGVDIICPKICTLDCVYCQIGPTPRKTLHRDCYIPPDEILAELRRAIDAGLNADFITVTGSGEPTLHSGLGSIIDSIKQLTDIPVALLTNGTLFSDPAVRADAARADVVLPSLDAPDEPTFEKINRPCDGLTSDTVISGLTAFRNEYQRPIWLELFLIDGVNTSDSHIRDFHDAIARIRPDRIHLNTAVRPTAEPGVRLVSPEKLSRLAKQFGPKCRVIARFTHAESTENAPHDAGDYLNKLLDSTLAMLQRRPCSIQDIASGLDITGDHATQIVKTLLSRAQVRSTTNAGVEFFHARTDDHPSH